MITYEAHATVFLLTEHVRMLKCQTNPTFPHGVARIGPGPPADLPPLAQRPAEWTFPLQHLSHPLARTKATTQHLIFRHIPHLPAESR